MMPGTNGAPAVGEAQIKQLAQLQSMLTQQFQALQKAHQDAEELKKSKNA
jgi:hypothetical protein